MRRPLITGGTGTLGRALVRALLADPAIERVAVLSRDEHKQEVLAAEFAGSASRLSLFLGDVRDRRRLLRAADGADAIIHAAALKRVPALEYDPAEAVKTNVLGTMNVTDAALATPSVEVAVLISTDKAAGPVNLYGATKLTAEKLWLAAAGYRGARPAPVFTAVRYGNVAGSRGSVVPRWAEDWRAGRPLYLTDPVATRFWVEQHEAVAVVLRAVAERRDGVVRVPRLPAVELAELAEAVAAAMCELGREGPRARGRPVQRIVGMRRGEKLHEWLITADEAALGTFDADGGGDQFIAGPWADTAGLGPTGDRRGLCSSRGPWLRGRELVARVVPLLERALP